MAILDINKFGALPTPVTAKDGQPLTIAEYVAFDTNNEKSVKDILDDLKKAIEQGGGSGESTGGDVTINDATLGGGLSFKDNKIELNLEDYLKIENDKLGIKLGTVFKKDSNNNIGINTNESLVIGSNKLKVNVYHGGAIKVGSSGLELSYNSAHFKISSNILELVNPDGGGSGSNYVLPVAKENILGGIRSGVSLGKPDYQNDLWLNVISGGPDQGKSYIDNASITNWLRKKQYINRVNTDNYYNKFEIGTDAFTLTENVDQYVIYGTKEEYPGPRIICFDNIDASTEKGWPVTGKVSGHLVVNKSFPVDASRYTHSQMLYITNSTGNDYKIFMRDGEGGFTEEGTEGVSEWRPWKEIQGMAILQGSDGSITVTNEDLNKVVDSGMYAGVYMTDDYTMDEETAITTGIETFTMIVVNNYAMSAILNELVGGLNVYFPKQIVQYKISSPLYGTPITNGSDSIPDPNLYKGKVQMRTGVYHDTTNTYVFTEWESIGGSIPIV